MRVWFMGMNSQLEDEAQAEVIVEGRTKDVMAAARALVNADKSDLIYSPYSHNGGLPTAQNRLGVLRGTFPRTPRSASTSSPTPNPATYKGTLKWPQPRRSAPKPPSDSEGCQAMNPGPDDDLLGLGSSESTSHETGSLSERVVVAVVAFASTTR